MHATDLSSRYPLSAVPASVERTFWRLYEIAGRRGAGGSLPRLSERKLAARVRVSKTTLRRHLVTLHEQGLVVRTLIDRIVIPLQDAERRFKRAAGLGHTDRSRATGPGPSATRTVPSPRQLPLVAMAHGPPRADQNGPPGWTPPDPQEPYPTTQDEKAPSTSSSITSVKDLDPQILVALSEQLGATVAYALEKLARRRRSWLVLLASRAERGLLAEYRRRNGRRLFALLQQALDITESGSAAQEIRFPGAWLRRLMDETEATTERAEGVSS